MNYDILYITTAPHACWLRSCPRYTYYNIKFNNIARGIGFVNIFIKSIILIVCCSGNR